jgi:hypothetical protein
MKDISAKFITPFGRHRRRGRPFVDGYGTPTFVQKKHSGGGRSLRYGRLSTSPLCCI